MTCKECKEEKYISKIQFFIARNREPPLAPIMTVISTGLTSVNVHISASPSVGGNRIRHIKVIDMTTFCCSFY